VSELEAERGMESAPRFTAMIETPGLVPMPEIAKASSASSR
jgi:hypothetical protein